MRTITVKGTGNVSARPDYIILSLNIEVLPCSKFIILVCDKTGFCVRSRYRFAHSTSDAGEDVAVNQIAVPALGVAVPFMTVGDEPPAAPPPDCHGIFFLHIVASFWQTNNITESRK